jgi:serine/threonine protein kinase
MAMSLDEGATLNNRYQILRVLSDKGGMGMIYQAHDLNLNGTVVIKQSRFSEQELQRQYPHLPAEQVRSQAEYLRKAFEREAKLLFGLRHSALPRVLDYFATPDGNQFFVMEFIPGTDFGELLSERLRQNQGPFPLDQVLGWAEQILDVLHYLHTNFDPPIIHRDIKPQNLKLMPNGQVILLDFGLAKGARPGMSVVESIHGHTPHYAPLEQINRKAGQPQPTDPRADIYSLAVTLHELLTGELPPDAVERVQAVAQGEPDPLRPVHELAPTIPATISEALRRAAAVFAKERLTTVIELTELMREAVALLRKLFGEEHLGNDQPFDEEKYQQAKPYFQAAVSDFEADDQDVREVMSHLIKALKEQYNFTADTIWRMKPYVIRFMNEHTRRAGDNELK